MYFARAALIPCKPEAINETIYKIFVTRGKLCLINLVLALCMGVDVVVDK